MTTLPASIEAYLQEAGFSTTEVLVLKRLLEGKAMTLRELAAKTGKSTGVLDQASKKLIERGIVSKKSINDSLKYTIASLDAVKQWMERDMEQQHSVLKRKKQDFEAFLTTVEHETGRPDMEFFEGLEGIQSAFKKLIKKDANEWLQFAPGLMREEDDPLSAFRAQLFRERRKRKIFMRVICPDVPLGHRYQSRDVFEYRKTRLVKPSDFPVAFEKVIVGDTVACFDLVNERASFIRFPEFADGQRKLFDMMWKQTELDAGVKECEEEAEVEKIEVPFKTKLLSAGREFFLAKRNGLIIVLCFLVSSILTVGLYRNANSVNTERIRERVKAIAATAAPEFDGNDVNQISKWQDYQKPEYVKLIDQLNDVRNRNSNVVYTYIMRPTEDPNFFEFVVDADSIDLRSREDLNEDGLINDMVSPGQLWLDPNPSDSAFHRGFIEPSADKEPVTDIWGIWISGHAPIRERTGKIVAVLGIDMYASDVKELTTNTFNPFVYFLGFLALLLSISFLTFSRNIVKTSQ